MGVTNGRLVVSDLSFNQEIKERGFDASPDEQDDERDGDSGDDNTRNVGDGELPFLHAEREGSSGARVGSRARQRDADEKRQAPRPVFFDLRFQLALCAFKVLCKEDVNPMNFAEKVGKRRDKNEDKPADDNVGYDASRDSEP